MLARTSLTTCLLLALCVACGGDDGTSTIYGSSAPTASMSTTDPSGMEDATTEDGDGDPDSTTSSSSSSESGDPSDTGTDTTESDTNADPLCGNGIIDPGEQCDGTNLAGFTCASLGFTGGVLACDPNFCTYDTSACTNDMGNQCDQYCNGCTCPSNECTMCCAQMGKVDACGGGMCSCF